MRLTKDDFIKVGKGTVIAALGAGIVYGLQGLVGLDWGIWQGVAVAITSVLVNLVRKWFKL